MGRHLSPSKVLIPPGISGPPINTWLVGPNGVSISSAMISQLTHVSNTQTDTQTMLRATSVAIGYIYVLCACDVP